MKDKELVQVAQVTTFFLIYKLITRNKKAVINTNNETSYNVGFIAAKLFRKLLK